jgi:hypothetical protein
MVPAIQSEFFSPKPLEEFPQLIRLLVFQFLMSCHEAPFLKVKKPPGNHPGRLLVTIAFFLIYSFQDFLQGLPVQIFLIHKELLTIDIAQGIQADQFHPVSPEGPVGHINAVKQAFPDDFPLQP